jgi:hypothetical protein
MKRHTPPSPPGQESRHTRRLWSNPGALLCPQTRCAPLCRFTLQRIPPRACEGRAGQRAQLAAQSQARVADVFGTPAGESGDLGHWEGADIGVTRRAGRGLHNSTGALVHVKTVYTRSGALSVGGKTGTVREITDTPCGVFPLANLARARYTSAHAAMHAQKKSRHDSHAATTMDE